MQNVVAVSHTVCAHVESHKNFVGRRAPHPCDGGVVDDLETRTFVCHESVFIFTQHGRSENQRGGSPGRGPPTPHQHGTTNPNRTPKFLTKNLKKTKNLKINPG